MKFALFSDIHNEFGTPWMPPASANEADVIILPGDIGGHTHGLTWASTAFPGKPIIYVAGNHEYYDAQLGLLDELRSTAAGLGIHFLECDSVEIAGVRFLGCTLWSSFDLFGYGEHQAVAMNTARRTINDFWMIRGRHGKRLEPRDSLSIHRSSWVWLNEELAKPFDGKTVVVTHFAPHRGCIAPEHQGSDVSPYFVSDMSDLMQKHPIAVWCYGHTHTNTDFIAENGCRVISNQLGYPAERTRAPDGIAFDSGFRNELIIEVR